MRRMLPNPKSDSTSHNATSNWHVLGVLLFLVEANRASSVLAAIPQRHLQLQYLQQHPDVQPGFSPISSSDLQCLQAAFEKACSLGEKIFCD